MFTTTAAAIALMALTACGDDQPGQGAAATATGGTTTTATTRNGRPDAGTVAPPAPIAARDASPEGRRVNMLIACRGMKRSRIGDISPLPADVYEKTEAELKANPKALVQCTGS